MAVTNGLRLRNESALREFESPRIQHQRHLLIDIQMPLLLVEQNQRPLASDS